MGYLFLGLAIIACVLGSSFLTASDGMKHKKYAVSGVLIFAVSYVLLSRSILTINISIAYAIFCGVGIILSSLISMVIFRQKMTKIGKVGIIFLAIVSVFWFKLPLTMPDIAGLILRRIQVIRYFLEEGFSLSVVEALLGTNDLDEYEAIFRQQMEETKSQIRYCQNRYDSLKGWYELLCEGKRVRMIGKDNITLKHVPTKSYMCMKGFLDIEDPYSEAKLETSHYTMAKSNGHSMIDVGGSYILFFEDFNDRIKMNSNQTTQMNT